MQFPHDRKDEVLRQINGIVSPHGLRAEYLEGIQSVGVQGDDRSYTPTVVLIGPHPGDELLAEISNTITNNTAVNRVTFELATKTRVFASTKPPSVVEFE